MVGSAADAAKHVSDNSKKNHVFHFGHLSSIFDESSIYIFAGLRIQNIVGKVRLALRLVSFHWFSGIDLISRFIHALSQSALPWRCFTSQNLSDSVNLSGYSPGDVVYVWVHATAWARNGTSVDASHTLTMSWDNPAQFSAITAVPEPSAYALLLAGLGLLGVMRRRIAA